MLIKKLRYWLVKKLLNNDEKYLIARAIEDRRSKVLGLCITDKNFDKYYAFKDWDDYGKLSEIFTTKDYNL